MLVRVCGQLVGKSATRLVVDCRGLGLEFGVPLSTSSAVGPVGIDILLYVDTHFSRSGVQLFGFAQEVERDVFRQLTSVPGIGPRAALNLLSRLSPAEIRSAIAAGRSDVMRSVPGIGPKKAETIIKKLQESADGSGSASPMLGDAEIALVSLGLTRREARERLGRIPAGDDRTLEELLKLALAQRT